MNDLVVTKALAQRIEYAEINFWLERLKALREFGENRYGVSVAQFGSAVAWLVRDIPDPAFNRVMGVTADTGAHLDDILDWYHLNNQTPRFDINPTQDDPQLLSALSARGLALTGFSTAMFGPALFQRRIDFGDGLRAHFVPSGDGQLFAEVYAAGNNFAPRLHPMMRDAVRVLFGRPGISCFGTHIGDRLTAMGILYVSDSMGYLTSSATLPDFRRQGCHAALIKSRLTEAASQQVDLAAAHVAFGSAAQRNLERAGMHIAYTKAILQPR